MIPDFRFSLDLHLNAVACDIQINDVPVFQNYSTDRANVEIPVSQYMVPGRNTVTIRAMTDISEGGMSATLARATLRATPYAISDWRSILTVETRARPTEIGDTSAQAEMTPVGPVSSQTAQFDGQRALLFIHRSIDLQCFVPSPEWITAPALDGDEVRDNLVMWYRWLVDAVAAKNVAVLRDVMRQKAQNLSLACNISPDIALNEIGLAEAAVDPALVPEPVNWDALTVSLAGNRRLARLYDPAEGTVVQFQDANSKLYFGYDFWVCRNGNSWKVCL